MPARHKDFSLWMGDEPSFTVAREAALWAMKHPEETAKYQEKLSDDDELLDMLVDEVYQTTDNVAIITVAGAMVNTDSYWNLIFGMTSYNTVSAALNRAVEDTDITAIVMNYSTSGGDAEGIGAVSENIKVAKQSKPVYSFSNTKALSAGYWMAASGDAIYGSPMSEWGSIGAIVTHTSMARMLKERGYDVTVFRGGEFKALGHPAEKLSEKAKKYLQGKVEKLYNFFLREISGERPSLKVENKDLWAEGKVFFAEDAVTVGLVDKVMSFNDLIASLVEVEEEEDLGVASASGTVGFNDEASTMVKQVILDPVAQARVASGVDLAEVPHEEIDPGQTAEGTESQEASDLNDGTPGENSEENTSEEESSEGTAAAEDPTPSTDLVSFLKDELASARTELAGTAAKLKLAESSSAQLEADVSSLKEIAIEATQRLQVSLGQAPVAMESLSAEAVAQQYSVSKKVFNERFKIGKQSLDADEADSDEDPDQEARKFGLVPKV